MLLRSLPPLSEEAQAAIDTFAGLMVEMVNEEL